MRHPAVIIRYLASDVLALVNLAREQHMDALWLLRIEKCELQSPDGVNRVQPESIEGEKTSIIESTRIPRVEVFELHNYVFQRLAALEKIPVNLLVEIQFTDEDEYCLVLTCTPTAICSKKPYSMGRGRLVDIFGGIDA